MEWKKCCMFNVRIVCTNTEIAVHNSGTRLASAIYYEGNDNSQIKIGQDMEWGAIKNVVVCGNIIGNGTASTNLNYNTISNAPDLTVYAAINNLNVLGTTKLNGATTCIGTLNVQGNIIGSGTALTNLN
jgi:hypothetical protein